MRTALLVYVRKALAQMSAPGAVHTGCWVLCICWWPTVACPVQGSGLLPEGHTGFPKTGLLALRGQLVSTRQSVCGRYQLEKGAGGPGDAVGGCSVGEESFS